VVASAGGTSNSVNAYLSGHTDMHNTSRYLKIILAAFLSVGAVTLACAETLAKRQVVLLQEIKPSLNNALLLPSDVAVSSEYVYVVDGGHHRVVAFDRQGVFQFSFGQHGKAKHRLNSPVGIDVADNGHVYVADTGNKRIQVFNAEGEFIRLFKVKSGRYLIRPIDVLVDEKNEEIFVTGNDNHKIMVFSLNGKLKRKWGGNGTNEGDFRYPATLAHLKDGRVAAVDVLNSRVQVFEKNGDYSIQISDWGVEPGQVFRPKGVAVDKNGNIYISDSYMNVVQVFSDIGKLKYVLEMPPSQPLYTPVGMSFDDDNRLYIAEMRNHRISVFNVNP